MTEPRIERTKGGYRLECETHLPHPIATVFPFFSDCRMGGAPFTSRSEITVWEPPFRFVDEQRLGPYQKWVHEHRFDEDGRSTRMTDRVDIRSPGGRAVHALFINRKVREIFRHRATLAGVFSPQGIEKQTA